MTAHEAVLTFECDDEHRARVVAASVREEIGEIAGDRTAAAVERTGREVEVRIEAADLVALRAGINTWCSFADVADRVAAIGPRSPDSE